MNLFYYFSKILLNGDLRYKLLLKLKQVGAVFPVCSGYFCFTDLIMEFF